ncbi:MAG: putative molybdenum carrier protein [Chthoniobacterales bacterium]
MQLTIVSGGQTGVDRAALAWARRNGIPHGGWCPRGRWSESGPIPRIYRLRETRSRAVGERTLWNVRDSDATAILCLHTKLTGGTAQTARFCYDLEKPLLFLSAAIWTPREAGAALRHFIRKNDVHVLNIAGPRASEEPGAAVFTRAVLDHAFRPCAMT